MVDTRPSLAATLPRLGVDLAGFFPRVLRNDGFLRSGVLHGRERVGTMWLRWSVVDPNRHVMYVWRKTTRSLTSSATELGASVFTDGPFTSYPAGGLRRALAQFGADAGGVLVRSARRPAPEGGLRAELADAALRSFQAPSPLGFVIGAREGIDERQVSRRRVHWFGRGAGHDFDSYRIAPGDPSDAEEAVGGLFRAVRDYRPYTVEQYIRVGYWALAPLTGDAALEAHGTAVAREEYAARVGDAPSGLVLVVAGWAGTQRLSHLLSAVRVRDAAQFDGGDSLLLGHGSVVRIGRAMPPWKQVLQCWGVQFQPLREPAGPSG